MQNVNDILALLMYGALQLAPLLVALACIVLYKNTIGKNSNYQDFFSSAIFCIGVRELLKNIRPRKR